MGRSAGEGLGTDVGKRVPLSCWVMVKEAGEAERWVRQAPDMDLLDARDLTLEGVLVVSCFRPFWEAVHRRQGSKMC